MPSATNDLDGVTRYIREFRSGSLEAGEKLMGAVYVQLRRMAAARMNQGHRNDSLQPTALVHEAWLRLGDAEFENRNHFFGAAAEAMRQILVEHARRRQCLKRGGGQEHVAMDMAEIAAPGEGEEVLAVHEALDLLAAHDARKAQLVKLRYFVGLSFEECAAVLSISVITAKRDWRYARAWLHHANDTAGRAPARADNPLPTGE